MFTVLIALCMLVGTIPAYAVNPYGSLTLTFTSEEDIDLGGIEISVYQAAPATVTETYTLYNETFHSTVTTDQNGSVTFAKPSQYCSITVELDSLPDGVGITKQTKFFNPDVTEQTIALATVDRAETELSGTEVKPTFYSADNVQLLADYEVVKSNNAYATMPWESINAMDSFALSGAFVDGNMSIPYSISVDISEANVAEKYTTLYDYGMISEREMILAQCDILSKPENSYMRTPEIVSTIEKYRDKLLAETVPMDSNVAAIFDAPIASPDLVLMEEVLAYDSTSDDNWQSQTVIASGTHAIVYSNLTSADGISASELSAFANAIVSEMNNIHYYFVTLSGFDAPTSPTGTAGKMAIEIVDDSHIDSYGRTMHNSCGRTYGDGYILINYDKKDYNVTNSWKTTLAHEYQHAIQYSYTINMHTWLIESCAEFASAMYAHNILGRYSHYAPIYSDNVNLYLLTKNQTLPSVEYSMLFPLYLYSNTGASGWNTIKQIYNHASSLTSTSLTSNLTIMNQALQSINSSYHLNDLFGDFAAGNIFLEETYPVFYQSNWTRVYYCSLHYASISSFKAGCSIAPLGTEYHELQDFTDDSGVAITFTLTSGSYADFSVYGIIHNGTETINNLYANAPNPERFTITLSDNTIEYYLGNSSGYDRYAVVTVNTSYSTPITYDIAVN